MGGGLGPTPSTSAPPGQRSASCQDVRIVYGEFSCLFGWYLQLCLPLVWVVTAVIQASSDRLRVGPNFLGLELFVRHDASSCATGGGSRGGGVLGPLGTTVPRGVSSESAGRPMGPATLQCQLLRDFVGLCLLFCSVFWDGCWVLCVVFFLSLGWHHVVRVGAL